jgi:hypothetical protein
LADNGIVAFITGHPLVGADQNTPGPGGKITGGYDVYEWRDGRPLLVTDGLTSWPEEEAPLRAGISPSGRDIFFSAPVQYTPDAVDSFRRYYDARIGGGIDFPQPPRPCALEVCQGTPRGAPEEAPAGTAFFSGPGNVKPQHKKHKKKHAKKHKKKQHKKHNNRANHKQRTAR